MNSLVSCIVCIRNIQNDRQEGYRSKGTPYRTCTPQQGNPVQNLHTAAREPRTEPAHCYTIALLQPKITFTLLLQWRAVAYFASQSLNSIRGCPGSSPGQECGICGGQSCTGAWFLRVLPLLDILSEWNICSVNNVQSTEWDHVKSWKLKCASCCNAGYISGNWRLILGAPLTHKSTRTIRKTETYVDR
jgi:hypothetical protein